MATTANANPIAPNAMAEGTNQKLVRRRSQYLSSCVFMMTAHFALSGLPSLRLSVASDSKWPMVRGCKLAKGHAKP